MGGLFLCAMSCFGGSLTAEQKERSKKSKKFDSKLHTRAKIMSEENKMLLLGPGESGKSTIFKQMKILGAGGYKEDELKSFKPIIASNCITQIQVLISQMPLLGIEYEDPENNARAERIAQLPTTADSWSSSVGEDIRYLWADKGIQEVYKHRDKDFQLNDSAEYFLSAVDRFIDPNYIPTVSDVLRARVRTTGIEEAEFDLEDFQFRMLDVGGQRSERRKWIHCFDCVTAVIFCSSLSEYDQTLREDDSQNRMKESLLLFDEIRNSPWFRTIPFILFLNKIDIFREKIKEVSLSVCFDDYKGKQTEKDGCEFIKSKFMEMDQDGQSKIHTHYTCAISTENVKVVFGVVKNSLLDDTLGETFQM